MIDYNHNSLSGRPRIETVPSFTFNSNNGHLWKRMNRSVPTVVLKLEHYESLGIIRSLGKLGIPVYGINASKFSHSSLSRYCKKTFVYDLENSSEEKSINFLLDIANYLGKRSVIIPTGDESSLFISRNAERLNDYFFFPKNPFTLISTLCSKKKNYFLAQHYNVPLPKSFFPASLEDVREFAEDIVFPVMLKGIDGGKLEKKTGKKMAIVKNKDELLSLYKSMEDHSETNLMIQEYIPHSKNQMWIFNGYFDSSSNCLAAFTGIKIRQNPVYTGMTSLGICRWNDSLINIVIKFLKDINYSGPVDIDFVYDVRDGKYKILDVNPRVGASFRMFVGTNGVDVVRAMYLDITRQPVHFSKPSDGRKWIVEDKDLLSSLHYYKNGELNFLEWLNSFKGIKEAGYYSLGDPIPFLFLWLNHLKKRFVKLLKKMITLFQFQRRHQKMKKISNNMTDPLANITRNESKQLKQVKNFYDQNNNWQGAIYETSEDPHAAGVRRRVQYILKTLDKNYDLRNIKVLDIGCGPGAYLNELNKRGAYTFGVDLSKEMLKVCGKNLDNNGKSNLLSADVNSLPFESKSFDLVLCIGVLQYVLSIENAISELNRITNTGGVLVICFENMIAASNIGYSLVYWLKQKFRLNPLSNFSKSDNNTGILSKWFLTGVSVPHSYRLYNPWKFEKAVNNSGFKKIEGMTYGYPFRILRKLKIIPAKSINLFEKGVESIMYRIRLHFLFYSGEFYIGFFKKESDLHTSVFNNTGSRQ